MNSSLENELLFPRGQLWAPLPISLATLAKQTSALSLLRPSDQKNGLLLAGGEHNIPISSKDQTVIDDGLLAWH